MLHEHWKEVRVSNSAPCESMSLSSHASCLTDMRVRARSSRASAPYFRKLLEWTPSFEARPTNRYKFASLWISTDPPGARAKLLRG